MKNDSETGDRATKWIRLIARIWSSPIIVYALIMLIGYAWNLATIGEADPYAQEDSSFIEAIPPILMFVSILGLGIAWRWERLGATINLVFLFAVFLALLIQRPITEDFHRSAIPYFLSMLIAVPGILFLVCWWRSKKRVIPQHGA